MISAIIFDCFGVVITDSLPAICAEQGVTDAAVLQEIADIVHTMNYGFVSVADGRKQIAAILGIAPADYDARIIQGEVKDTALLAYIAALRPRYKTGMLSNVGSKSSLYGRFEPGELERCFDVVVASGDIGFAKPEVQAYQYAADQLRVRLDECVMIDDRQLYYEAALAAGMQAVLYKNRAQATQELDALLNT